MERASLPCPGRKLGGSAPLALRGCAELVAEIQEPFDLIVCPVGTGGTLAGLSAGVGNGQHALGFAVLRGAEYLSEEVSRLQAEAFGEPLPNWSIDHRFHCGGFARRTVELDEFIIDFRERHGILLDWVYVAKAMSGLLSCIEEGSVRPGSTAVFVVTGPASPPSVHPSLRAQRRATALVEARTCYDHLAGRRGVQLRDRLLAAGALREVNDRDHDLTEHGHRLVTELGVNPDRLLASRRVFARCCVDWTHRRPHLAGALPATLTSRFISLGWLTRRPGRELRVAARRGAGRLAQLAAAVTWAGMLS